MQSGVFAFVVINVDGNFFQEMKGLAVGGLDAFQVSPENVVCFTGGHALGKFAVMIGVKLPADLLRLIGGAPNLYGNAVYGMIVGAPDGSENESVGLFFLVLVSIRRRVAERSCAQKLRSQTEEQHFEDYQRARENPRGRHPGKARPRSRSNHRLRSPRLPLPPLRSRLRRPSTPGERW